MDSNSENYLINQFFIIITKYVIRYIIYFKY